MTTFTLRLIHLGNVINTGTITADTEQAAWTEAHPALMDPCVQCKRGDPVRWVEIKPTMDGDA